VHERVEEKEAAGSSARARASTALDIRMRRGQEKNGPMHVIELRIVHAWAEKERGERGVLGREEEDGRELGEGEEACAVSSVFEETHQPYSDSAQAGP
jgi:hypothetical protein